MVKKLTFIATCLLLSVLVNAQSQKFQFAKGTGGVSTDFGYAITVDLSGNIYTTGNFQGTVDFDPNAGIYNLVSAGSDDIFISKSDASGNLIWAKKMGGSLSDYGLSIELDQFGNIYTTGYFQGIADFDPNGGVYNMTSAGSEDFFILKLNASGNFVWAKRIGGTSFDESQDITIDVSGNVYTTGTFRYTADFDPGVGSFNLTSVGDNDIFISKLDSSGNFVWAKQIGNTPNEFTYALTLDSFGNIYTVGGFEGTLDFDPNAGIYNLTATGNLNIFISKLNSNGNFIWAKRMGGNSSSFGNAITLDKSGYIFITGEFDGIVDFDPSINIFNLTSNGADDMYIAKLDSGGNFLWAKSLGGAFQDDGISLAVDTIGNVYTTGIYSGSMDFDPGAGIFILPGAGYFDIFILKLDALGNFVWAKNMGGPLDDYGYGIQVDLSGNVYTTGLFQDTVDFDPGAGVSKLISSGNEDIFIHKLNTCQPTNYSFSINACDSFSLNGKIYITSGTFIQTLENSVGCDSIITINIQIKHSTSLILSQTACKSYTLNNTKYTTNGTYTQTLMNKGGCDSILTLNLTIISVNDSVTKSGATLVASATGATYQWVKCPTYSILSGSTNKSYTASKNGDYALIITQNACTDTSICYTISGLGVTGNIKNNSFKVYPNPTIGLFDIDVSTPAIYSRIEIYNSIGDLISIQTLVNEKTTINLINNTDGLYFVNLFDNENNIISEKIIKTK